MEYDLLIDKVFDLLNNIIKKYKHYKYSFDNLDFSEEKQDDYILIQKEHINKQKFFKQELDLLIKNIKTNLKYDNVKLYYYEWPEYEYFYYELYINNILCNIINKLVNINFIINCNNEIYAEIFYEALECKLIIYPINNNQQHYTIEKYMGDKCIFEENYYFYGSRKDCLQQIYEIIVSIS